MDTLKLNSRYLCAALLSLAAPLIVTNTASTIGWLAFIIGAAIILAQDTKDNSLVLAYVAAGMLYIAPITSDATRAGLVEGLVMLVWLSLCVAVPYLLDRHVLKTNNIKFSWQAKMPKRSKPYILFFITATIASCALFLNYYLTSTGSFLNWDVTDDWLSYVSLLVGAFFVGFWDELFFINTIFASYTKAGLNWLVANLLQGVIFYSFLWEIGFRSWGVIVLYPFVLAQGAVYRETKSLAIVITTHLILDAILVIVLIGAHT